MIPMVSKYWLVRVWDIKDVLSDYGLTPEQTATVCGTIVNNTCIRFTIQSQYQCGVGEPHVVPFTGEYVGVFPALIRSSLLEHHVILRRYRRMIFRLWNRKVATMYLGTLVCAEHFTYVKSIPLDYWGPW